MQSDVMRVWEQRSAANKDRSCFLEYPPQIPENDDNYLLYVFNVTNTPAITGATVMNIGDTSDIVINTEEMEGDYNMFFVSCLSGHTLTYEIELEWFNLVDGEKTYLPIGEVPNVGLAFLFTMVYSVMCIVWSSYLRKAKADPNVRVFKLHNLFTIFLLFKMFSMVFEGLKLANENHTGTPSGWTWFYYAFVTVKFIVWFMIVLLIATGWSFIRPVLDDNDRKLFMAMVPLQVMFNVAEVVYNEVQPGTRAFYSWSGLFHMADLICCALIFFPVTRSLEKLRDQAEGDAANERAAEKLAMFQSFYGSVVAYVYFTRVLLILLDATLPFKLLWLSFLGLEAASLAFVANVGYRFRPIVTNPYMNVVDENDFGGELGAWNTEATNSYNEENVPLAGGVSGEVSRTKREKDPDAVEE